MAVNIDLFDETKFSNDDYNSNEGMLTYSWGPPLWHFLHIMSFNYPNNPTTEQIEYHISYIKSLVYILPCKYCRINLPKNLVKVGITRSDFDNRLSFSKLIYRLHNEVNLATGKKKYKTYEEVRVFYENFRSRCDNSIKKNNPNVENGCTKPLHAIKLKTKIVITNNMNSELGVEIN